jgi:hypothetical protein
MLPSLPAHRTIGTRTVLIPTVEKAKRGPVPDPHMLQAFAAFAGEGAREVVITQHRTMRS